MLTHEAFADRLDAVFQTYHLDRAASPAPHVRGLTSWDRSGTPAFILSGKRLATLLALPVADVTHLCRSVDVRTYLRRRGLIVQRRRGSSWWVRGYDPSWDCHPLPDEAVVERLATVWPDDIQWLRDHPTWHDTV